MTESNDEFPVGLWCGSWALVCLLAVTFFGELSFAAAVSVAVRAFLWAIPIGLVTFGLATQTELFVNIPGRWLAAAWIVMSVLAGIPEMNGSYEDGSEACYDKQGSYSC